MGYLFFVFVAIQLTTASAIQSIPFRCFLQDPVFMGILNHTSEFPRSAFLNPTKNPFQSEIIKVDPVSFEQDGLLFETKDMETKGIQNALLDNIEFNFEAKQIRVTMRFEDVFVTSQYKSAGSLFLLPVEGDGSFSVDMKNVQVYLIVPFDIIDANGFKAIDLKEYTFWYDVKDKAQFKLTNLYYGNQELSESMHSLINQNWKLLTIQFGRHYFNKLVSSMFGEFRKYMLGLPLRDFSKC